MQHDQGTTRTRLSIGDYDHSPYKDSGCQRICLEHNLYLKVEILRSTGNNKTSEPTTLRTIDFSRG